MKDEGKGMKGIPPVPHAKPPHTWSAAHMERRLSSRLASSMRRSRHSKKEERSKAAVPQLFRADLKVGAPCVRHSMCVSDWRIAVGARFRCAPREARHRNHPTPATSRRRAKRRELAALHTAVRHLARNWHSLRPCLRPVCARRLRAVLLSPSHSPLHCSRHRHRSHRRFRRYSRSRLRNRHEVLQIPRSAGGMISTNDEGYHSAEICTSTAFSSLRTS
jgi:hypothetical protein